MGSSLPIGTFATRLSAQPLRGATLGANVLEALGISPWRQVHGRACIADFYNPGRRCGIYVLRFSNIKSSGSLKRELTAKSGWLELPRSRGRVASTPLPLLSL